MKRRKITVNGIHLSPFTDKGIRRVVSRFCKTKRDVEVRFVPKGNKYGQHQEVDGVHVVAICIAKHVGEYPDTIDTKVHMLDTLIHELRHAQQSEEWSNYYDDDLHRNPRFKGGTAKYMYSVAELDARAYAMRHVLNALEVHDG